MAKRSPGRGRRVRKTEASAVATPTPIPTLRFIESSALAAALLEADAGAVAALRAKGRRVTSALTIAETGRAIIRARVAGRLNAAQAQQAVRALRTFERRTYIVEVSADVLARVGRPFPVEPVRTLDAVHLATAELLGEPPQLVTIVTKDERIRENATALGYAIE